MFGVFAHIARTHTHSLDNLHSITTRSMLIPRESSATQSFNPLDQHLSNRFTAIWRRIKTDEIFFGRKNEFFLSFKFVSSGNMEEFNFYYGFCQHLFDDYVFQLRLRWFACVLEFHSKNLANFQRNHMLTWQSKRFFIRNLFPLKLSMNEMRGFFFRLFWITPFGMAL